jgi:hypothetical protein
MSLTGRNPRHSTRSTNARCDVHGNPINTQFSGINGEPRLSKLALNSVGRSRDAA